MSEERGSTGMDQEDFLTWHGYRDPQSIDYVVEGLPSDFRVRISLGLAELYMVHLAPNCPLGRTFPFPLPPSIDLISIATSHIRECRYIK